MLDLPLVPVFLHIVYPFAAVANSQWQVYSDLIRVGRCVIVTYSIEKRADLNYIELPHNHLLNANIPYHQIN
jgi:hypothetical protein